MHVRCLYMLLCFTFVFVTRIYVTEMTVCHVNLHFFYFTEIL